MEIDFDPIPIRSCDNEFFAEIKPMVFAGNPYYPNGGWEDFQGFFDDVKSAKNWVEECRDYQWAHIVLEGKIIASAFYQSCRESKWIWEKGEE